MKTVACTVGQGEFGISSKGRLPGIVRGPSVLGTMQCSLLRFFAGPCGGWKSLPHPISITPGAGHLWDWEDEKRWQLSRTSEMPYSLVFDHHGMSIPEDMWQDH